MILWFPSFRTTLALAAILAISACAQPRLPTVPKGGDAGFSYPAVTEVFTAGYENIAEKYLDPLPLEEVGLEALRGLGAIDPALAIEREGDVLFLTGDGIQIAEFSVPENPSPTAWGQVTTQIAGTARTWSDEVRKASAEKIYEAVFDGMLSELDIYSRYAGADEAKRNRARRDGFGGIGIRYKRKKGTVRISRVTPGTPASEAGLVPGDVILSADGKTLSGLLPYEISKILRGRVDSKLRLLIKSATDAKPKTITLTRRHIVLETVTATLDDGVLQMKISTFNQKTARSVKKQVQKHWRETDGGLKGLVMDLRGNPGGLLRQSIDLANLFLTQGHIITTRGRHPDSLHHYNANGEDVLYGRPLVILVDGKSASASEITAAALQDRNRAVVVGTSSYGKGSVQTVIRLPNDGELTITWSRLITPTGYTLHGLGVHPAVCTSSMAIVDEGNAKNDRITAALNGPKAAQEIFDRWRRPGLLSKDERADLRETCPPERHKKNADITIARRMILNSALYDRALALTGATSEARQASDPIH